MYSKSRSRTRRFIRIRIRRTTLRKENVPLARRGPDVSPGPGDSSTIHRFPGVAIPSGIENVSPVSAPALTDENRPGRVQREKVI